MPPIVVKLEVGSLDSRIMSTSARILSNSRRMTTSLRVGDIVRIIAFDHGWALGPTMSELKRCVREVKANPTRAEKITAIPISLALGELTGADDTYLYLRAWSTFKPASKEYGSIDPSGQDFHVLLRCAILTAEVLRRGPGRGKALRA